MQPDQLCGALKGAFRGQDGFTPPDGINKAATNLRHMDLGLDRSLAAAYQSKAQVARVVTEDWVGRELYCPSCTSDSLTRSLTGRAVVDFSCDSCSETFQLKSRSKPFRSRVLDSAYGPMIESVAKSQAPSFLFLQYSCSEWRVREVFLVPHFFMSPSAIEKRRPLRASAQRAGWIGCNILLDALPVDARIAVVRDGRPRLPEQVRDAWRMFSFMRGAAPESRGWMADVLACVRELGEQEFSLTEMYAFEGRLRHMHRDNRNIRPKIRQQLQVLRDHGALEFLGRGRYRVLLVPQIA